MPAASFFKKAAISGAVETKKVAEKGKNKIENGSKKIGAQGRRGTLAVLEKGKMMKNAGTEKISVGISEKSFFPYMKRKKNTENIIPCKQYHKAH